MNIFPFSVEYRCELKKKTIPPRSMENNTKALPTCSHRLCVHSNSIYIPRHIISILLLVLLDQCGLRSLGLKELDLCSESGLMIVLQLKHWAHHLFQDKRNTRELLFYLFKLYNSATEDVAFLQTPGISFIVLSLRNNISYL